MEGCQKTFIFSQRTYCHTTAAHFALHSLLTVPNCNVCCRRQSKPAQYSIEVLRGVNDTIFSKSANCCMTLNSVLFRHSQIYANHCVITTMITSMSAASPPHYMITVNNWWQISDWLDLELALFALITSFWRHWHVKQMRSPCATRWMDYRRG